MKSNSAPKYFIVAVIALVGFLIYRYKSRSQAAYEASQPRQQVAPPESQPQFVEDKKVVEESAADFRKQRIEYEKREKVGISKVPLLVGGVLKLNVEIRPKPLWCRAGDIDVIKRVIDDSVAKDIILSFESANGESLGKPLRVSTDDLYKGIKTTVELKDASPTNNHNVFVTICSDRREKNKCSGLKVVDLNTINNSVQKLKKGNLKGDYLFYFQNFFIAKGELVTYRSDDYSTKYRNEVESFLKKEAVPLDGFKKSWKMGQSIRSTPVTVEGRLLVINLPHNDLKCRPH